MIRKIVQIDEELCDGCGQCAPSCAEGAIQVIDGKARLVSERYCDGLGACLGECTRCAISVFEREAAEFYEAAVQPAQRLAEHIRSAKARALMECPGGCPGSTPLAIAPLPPSPAAPQSASASGPSQLRQWPVQLALLSPGAPYFKECDLLVAADCVPFAAPDFHASLLRGKALAVACPKLDSPAGRVERLAAIFAGNGIKSLTVAIMEVPCCMGLARWVDEALRQSGKDLPVEVVVYTIQGRRK
ncbi:MAG: 4Fe-4S binding protein [Candidatus Sumerlaeota bacterium]|nr:4Fe-4S binding protein [Candidatus Sumerlaeota bacterium]